jgi:hypothetical protein
MPERRPCQLYRAVENVGNTRNRRRNPNRAQDTGPNRDTGAGNRNPGGHWRNPDRATHIPRRERQRLARNQLPTPTAFSAEVLAFAQQFSAATNLPIAVTTDGLRGEALISRVTATSQIPLFTLDDAIVRGRRFVLYTDSQTAFNHVFQV